MQTSSARPLPRPPRRLAAPWCRVLAGALLLAPLTLSLTPAAADHLTSGRLPAVVTDAATAPANDNYANAQAITGVSGSVTGSNVGATRQIGEPVHAGVGGGASVWYNWSPPSTGTAIFSTSGSNFDTVLAVYTGNSVVGLTEVASDDDFGNLTSQVSFTARMGTTYRIAVDGFGGDTGSILLSWTTSTNTTIPLILSASRAAVQVNTAFSYQIRATNIPTSYAASGLPTGVSLNSRTGLISGTPTTAGTYYAVVGATNSNGTGQAGLTITVSAVSTHPEFFSGEVALSRGAYYLQLFNGNVFGYYAYLTDPRYVYHYDLGYEFVFDAEDYNSGIYLYDFKSRGFFYTSPYFAFPYLYDFTLNSPVYYYPDPSNPGRYNTNGVRYFYVFSTGQIVSK